MHRHRFQVRIRALRKDEIESMILRYYDVLRNVDKKIPLPLDVYV